MKAHTGFFLTMMALSIACRAEQARAPTGGGEPAENVPLTASELEELVAPVALYVDPLLAQVLPASTDPAAVKKAASYARITSRGVVGVGWSPAVTALAKFHPEILVMMDDYSDWTELLGQTLTNQEADLLRAIQQVRTRAHAAGNLVTNQEQTVRISGGEIQILPPASGDIYPASYDPAAIFLPAPPQGSVVSYGQPANYGGTESLMVDWGQSGIYVVDPGQFTTISNANAYGYLTAYGDRGYARWRSPRLRQTLYGASTAGSAGIGPAPSTMARIYGPGAGLASAHALSSGSSQSAGIGPSPLSMAQIYGPAAGVASAYSLSSGRSTSPGIGPGVWSGGTPARTGLSRRPGGIARAPAASSSVRRAVPRSSRPRARPGRMQARATARSSGLASSARGQSALRSSSRGSRSRGLTPRSGSTRRGRIQSGQRRSARSSAARSSSSRSSSARSRSRSGRASAFGGGTSRTRAAGARGARSRSAHSGGGRSRGGGGRSRGGGGRSRGGGGRR